MSYNIILKSDSYTCVSSAWKSYSQLYHMLSTYNIHTSIVEIKIDYEFIMSDHHPFITVIRQNNILKSLYNKYVIQKKSNGIDLIGITF